MNIVGLYSDAFFTAPKQYFKKFRSVITSKANPRNQDYMRNLLNTHYPTAEFVHIDNESGWLKKIENSSTIVLLYPDSIGLGYTSIEDKCSGKELWVINGRKRHFKLTKDTKKKFQAKRFLEVAMLMEFIMIFVFLLSTPCLVMIDFCKGKR